MKALALLQPVLQFFNNSGNVLNGGFLHFYESGSTTPKNTYTDTTKGTPNSNPVTLDTAGRPISGVTPVNIFLDGTYKLVVKDSAGNTIRTVDPVNALGQQVQTRETSSNDTVDETDRDYIIEGDASGGSITLTVTAASTLGNGFRFGVQKIDNTANTVTIDFHSSETCNGHLTFVITAQYDMTWFTCDGTQWIAEVNSTFPGDATIGGDLEVTGDTSLNSDLSVTGNLAVGGTATIAGKVVLGAALNEAQGTDIASATTTNIGAATGNFINITGTTTITGLGTVTAGTHRTVRFTGSLILTNNATSLILPTGSNITTQAGDTADFRSLGSGNWLCTQYMPIGILPIRNIAIQTFTASGTYTPTAKMIACLIECWGGGGGSGGINASGANSAGGGGGGAGSYSVALVTAATVGASQVATIGAGGTAGASGSNAGGNGGDTSVGSLCIGKGGSGGAGGVIGAGSGAGGAGGVAGTGNIFTGVGNDGEITLTISSAIAVAGQAKGGATSLGGVKSGGNSSAAGISPAANSGSGATGALSYNSGGAKAGAAGAAGLIRITEYCG